MAVAPKGFSYSQMSMFLKCGEQYYRRYIKGDRIPPGVALIRGTGQHKAQELDLTAKRDKGELLPKDEVTDIASDATKAAWAQGVRLNDDEMAKGVSVMKAKTIDDAVRLAELHHDAVAPGIEPKMLEVKFELKTNVIPRPIIGYADIIETNGTIRDTKTRSKTPRIEDFENDDQLVIYDLAYQAGFDKAPAGHVYDFLVNTKTPKAISLPIKPFKQEDHARTLSKAARVFEAISKGTFLPANPGSWWCSRRWCGYYETCPYVRGGAKVTVPKAIGTMQEGARDAQD